MGACQEHIAQKFYVAVPKTRQPMWHSEHGINNLVLIKFPMPLVPILLPQGICRLGTLLVIYIDVIWPRRWSSRMAPLVR